MKQSLGRRTNTTEKITSSSLEERISLFSQNRAYCLEHDLDQKESKMYSPLSLQIKCSVCLSDFTDPVTLSCEHSFCRECITGHMQASLGPSACPECQRPYNKEDLKSSRLLRNMTSTVREHLAEQKSDRSTSKEGTQALNSPEMEKMLMCSEHDEKLKLFCETDQKLVCVICRDGDKHKGHVFKPVKEAAQINKVKLGYLHKSHMLLPDESTVD